jgi:hypothetical protein
VTEVFDDDRVEFSGESMSVLNLTEQKFQKGVLVSYCELLHSVSCRQKATIIVRLSIELQRIQYNTTGTANVILLKKAIFFQGFKMQRA